MRRQRMGRRRGGFKDHAQLLNNGAGFALKGAVHGAPGDCLADDDLSEYIGMRLDIDRLDLHALLLGEQGTHVERGAKGIGRREGELAACKILYGSHRAVAAHEQDTRQRRVVAHQRQIAGGAPGHDLMVGIHEGEVGHALEQVGLEFRDALIDFQRQGHAAVARDPFDEWRPVLVNLHGGELRHHRESQGTGRVGGRLGVGGQRKHEQKDARKPLKYPSEHWD